MRVYQARGGIAECASESLGCRRAHRAMEQRRQLHCGKLTAAIPAGYTAVVKPSKMSAIQTQVVTEALMLFACERPVCARSGPSRKVVLDGRGRLTGHASRSGVRDELSYTSFRHGGLTEGADSDHSDAELCADELHPRASHSGAKGGRTKRWSFGRAAIAARSSSLSWVPSASRLAFWLSGRAAFGITMTPS